MNLENIQTFYFVGIGGIGMSALARYFKLKGNAVYGYDKTPSALTSSLASEEIEVGFVDDISNIPTQVLDKEHTLIVYTPAIPKHNKLLQYFTAEGFSTIKRAALLGEITKDSICLAVAGTHGKTTTSAILGHLLAECNMPVTAFLGGIAENYNSNFIYRGHEITVVEADEFDRSFLQLQPDIACVTSMDADHLDIYGDASAIEDAFRDFSKLLPKRENFLYKKGLPLDGRTVAVGEAADFEAQNIRIEDGSYVFDLKTPLTTLKDLQFSLPGHHNLFNAITALGMAILAGSPTDCLSKALLSFKGVQRRFSYKIKSDDLVLIDDYAHHPTEIDALYQAVSEMYPEDRKLVVFQPHLFSRTRDFVEGFAQSLSRFDEIVLLDIYPAREEPIEGISSDWLLEKIKNKNKKILSKEALGKEMMASNCRVQLLVGAGDIGAEVDALTQKLKDEN
ncbi:UDP-N-acetylmuramate--L-alanine ligase [Ulvibacter antarcticus]|uniref:UDP-N-acetylmuramate--L-alanine ligase n=1 Tax=Ulvibacter antarcticus TaxID=442714 RepID=UPI000EF9E009|nr:UDP-N-acetylmuramate--L-alanine ligase [Ulvibacter antarcticus]